MSFRHKKSKVAAARHWQKFITENTDLIRLSGISLKCVSDEDRWWYFLDHGCLYPEEDFFSSSQLKDDEANALVELVARFFEAFSIEHFDPTAISLIGYTNQLRNRLGREPVDWSDDRI